MTRIDFYLLADAPSGSQELAACKLANKAFNLGHRIYILTRGPEESGRLDQLLWTFSASSFVPHGLNSGQGSANVPVLIGDHEPPAGYDDVLISLAERVPEWFSRFQRVAEIVGSTETEKSLARERFRFYRDRGYELLTHNL